MIRRILISIIVNSVIVYLVTLIGPQVGIHGMTLQPAEWASLLLFFILGAVFWICYDGVRAFLELLTKPLSWLTLWLTNLIITVSILYLFALIVNRLDLGVSIVMGNLREVVVTSLVISVCNLFLK